MDGARDILRTFEMNARYFRALMEGVEEGQMTVQPVFGMNHAAWIAGHLAYSFQAIGGEMGMQPWLPADWAGLFGTGTTPVSDPAMYPGKDRLMAVFEEGQMRIVWALRGLSDVHLAMPLPDERHRETFPTLGSAVLQILAAHMAVHLGQLSAWRRAVGLGAVREPM
jgi:hypothetical protein